MRRWAVLEVTLFWSVMFLLNRTHHWNPLAQWLGQFSSWGYFSHILCFVLPVAAILIRRRRLRDYGLTLNNWRTGLAWGGSITCVFALPFIVAYSAGWVAFDAPRGITDTLFFQVIMAGFGEEILYRGYYQPLLNDGFGRPWSFLGLRFGWGLILTSLIFGLDHALNSFDPFHAQYGFDWSWGLAALSSGLLLGILRERTGSILAPAIVHGLDNVWITFTAQPGSWVVTSVGSPLQWVVLWAALVMTVSAGNRGRTAETEGA